MSKALKALEALEKISKVDCIIEGAFDDFFGMFSEEYNVIKNALEDYEKLKKEKLLLSACRDLPTLEKKLKALEIIKKYPMWKGSVNYLLHMAHHWKESNRIITKGLLEVYDFPFEIEEFVLLSEVLL